MKIEISNAKESITKTVKAQGNTGRVYLPKSWIGREIEVILLPEKKIEFGGESMSLKKYEINENLTVFIRDEMDIECYKENGADIQKKDCEECYKFFGANWDCRDSLY